MQSWQIPELVREHHCAERQAPSRIIACTLRSWRISVGYEFVQWLSKIRERIVAAEQLLNSLFYQLTLRNVSDDEYHLDRLLVRTQNQPTTCFYVKDASIFVYPMVLIRTRMLTAVV